MWRGHLGLSLHQKVFVEGIFKPLYTVRTSWYMVFIFSSDLFRPPVFLARIFLGFFSRFLASPRKSDEGKFKTANSTSYP